MKNYHNIEKSAFKPGAYVGYGGGLVWHITKTNSTFGNWIARPLLWITQDTTAHEKYKNRDVYAMRLADMSEKLAAL